MKQDSSSVSPADAGIDESEKAIIENHDDYSGVLLTGPGLLLGGFIVSVIDYFGSPMSPAIMIFAAGVYAVFVVGMRWLS